MSNLTRGQAAKILDIAVNATNIEAKKAYKRKSLKYHPDRPNGNEEKFKQLKEVYEFFISNKNFITGSYQQTTTQQKASAAYRQTIYEQEKKFWSNS